MTLGLMADERTFATFADVTAWIDAVPPEFGSVWLGSHRSWDPLALIAATGPRRPGLAFGSAVVLAHTQHPVALAMQALTAQAATAGKLTLGLSAGHRQVMRQVYGHLAARPAEQMREYLSVLSPLLRGEQTDFSGRYVTVSARVTVTSAPAPRLLIGALGPALLRLAGSLADGVIVSWATATALAEYIVPAVTSAASDAGRPDPAIVATVPVCVGDNAAELRDWAARRFAATVTFPSYAAILQRGGTDDVADAMALGSAAAVTAQFGSLIEAGATEIVAMPVGSQAQIASTQAALAAWRPS
jgi:F420-dependent oxidoreductase-like protein